MMLSSSENAFCSKAAVYSVEVYFDKAVEEKLQVTVTATAVYNSGQTSSGQTEEAFHVSVRHAKAVMHVFSKIPRAYPRTGSRPSLRHAFFHGVHALI